MNERNFRKHMKFSQETGAHGGGVACESFPRAIRVEAGSLSTIVPSIAI